MSFQDQMELNQIDVQFKKQESPELPSLRLHNTSSQKILNISLKDSNQQLVITYPSIRYLLEPSFNQSHRKEYLILKLDEMGYDKFLVDEIIERMGLIEVNQAVELLQQNNDGLFIHNYVGQLPNVCEKCGQDSMLHLNLNNQFNQTKYEQILDKELDLEYKYLPSKLSNRYNNSEDLMEEPSNKSQLKCCVCTLYRYIKDFAKIDKCSHYICKSCIYEYLKTKIMQSQVENIICPIYECKEILQNKFILSNIDEQLVYKYEKFKLNNQINLNPDARQFNTFR